MDFAAIEDVDDLDLIPDEDLEETYLERFAGLKGSSNLNKCIYFLSIDFISPNHDNI